MSKKTEMTPKIAEMVKASGACDERGIMFLAHMAACRITPEVGQPPYQGKGILLGQGRVDADLGLGLIALNGDKISAVAFIKSGMFGTSLSARDLENRTQFDKDQIRKIEVVDGAVRFDLRTDEKLGVITDKNNEAAVKEFAKAVQVGPSAAPTGPGNGR